MQCLLLFKGPVRQITFLTLSNVREFDIYAETVLANHEIAKSVKIFSVFSYGDYRHNFFTKYGSTISWHCPLKRTIVLILFGQKWLPGPLMNTQKSFRKIFRFRDLRKHFRRKHWLHGHECKILQILDEKKQLFTKQKKNLNTMPKLQICIVNVIDYAVTMST